MPKFLSGVVSRIVQDRGDLIRLEVDVDGALRRAVAFKRLTQDVSPGDRVILNITAAQLGLGSGGEDFVLWNLAHQASGEMSGGHIVKLRYTPGQLDVMAAEAPESPHHEQLKDVTSIEGMPVVACGLHSQVAAVVAGIRAHDSGLKVAYVMTDGAALPLALSDTVAALLDKGWVHETITCGHAFGGGLETVNVFSALVAARHAVQADVTVVAMGPGVVGTDTLTGHTEMEQGQVLGAARSLQGTPVACLRINLAEPRERHRPVSHHTKSALALAAPEGCLVAVPELEPEPMEQVMSALSDLAARHALQTVDPDPGLGVLKELGIPLQTMGRTMEEVPEFFAAGVAAGRVAAEAVR